MVRVIKTNLENSKKASEMIAGVVGQLSDGIWEGSNKCKGYWMFAECSRTSDIIVSDKYYMREYGTNKFIANPYQKMTDEQIKKYFAKKLKEIVIVELKDKYEEEIASQIFGELYPMYCGAFYLIKDSEEYNQKLDKYNAFLKEHPFISKGKFNDKNDDGISYLSYGETMTVSDVYKVYKVLNQ